MLIFRPFGNSLLCENQASGSFVPICLKVQLKSNTFGAKINFFVKDIIPFSPRHFTFVLHNVHVYEVSKTGGQLTHDRARERHGSITHFTSKTVLHFLFSRKQVTKQVTSKCHVLVLLILRNLCET